MQIEPHNTRGPLWAPAQELHKWIPDFVQTIPPSNTASNWLSSMAKLEKVKRRERNPMKEHVGLGRPPRFEYNVASVRKLVKERTSR